MTDKKVITIHDRIPKLREERRRKANRRLIFFLSLFFLLILLIIYAQSPLSYVRSIEISGNQYVHDDLIIETSRITERTNLWEINKEETIRHILQLDEIRHANLKRKFPNSVEIIVSEYDRIAYLANEGAYYPIAENGKILDKVPLNKYQNDAPILINFEQGIIVEEFASELKNVPNGIMNRISEIYYEPTSSDPNRVILYMNDGNIVYSTVRNFAERISAYPIIAQEIDPNKKGIIHMRMTPYFEEFDELSEEEEDESHG